jgi:hypothetical protein
MRSKGTVNPLDLVIYNLSSVFVKAILITTYFYSVYFLSETRGNEVLKNNIPVGKNASELN